MLLIQIKSFTFARVSMIWFQIQISVKFRGAFFTIDTRSVMQTLADTATSFVCSQIQCHIKVASIRVTIALAKFALIQICTFSRQPRSLLILWNYFLHKKNNFEKKINFNLSLYKGKHCSQLSPAVLCWHRHLPLTIESLLTRSYWTPSIPTHLDACPWHKQLPNNFTSLTA